MQIPFLDLQRQYTMLQPAIDELVGRVLAEQRFVGGERVASFEKAFSAAHGVDHCIGVGNATDALFIILKALEIGEGDEVIVPAHGWISAAEMVLLSGAKPVFADVDAYSYCLNTESIEKLVTPKTRAIIPIHLYGQMADMQALKAFADSRDILLIEDCAQAHFASNGGQMAGSIGIAGTFSFYPSKLLGAIGDGGCITTRDQQLAAKCRTIANHGGKEKNNHQIPGLNSRLDTLQAAVLEFKMHHVDDWITARNHIAGFYERELKQIKEVITPHISLGNSHNFHIYALQVEKRDQLKAYLAAAGIQTEIHYPTASPFTPAFSKLGYKATDFPVSTRLQGSELSLPIYETMTHREVDHVVTSIKTFYGR
ncbi:MAG: DegT/DnrJ/EryC1/StrS family aminotransferase [Roseivirga sp.]|nr:DegT/DnrJ/EryC1/StrS family aminotransferase [Roseivirga sp.]